MINNTYEYTKIRENIWQITEDDGVCCTLAKGSELAVLIDTGYGRRNLRSFIEDNISTPYMVINSHGHPDHIGGNHWFDSVYALQKEWSVIHHFEGNKSLGYEQKVIQTGENISLGNLNISVVSLSGHTKGSIGFLVREEELLIAGDALNECLWLFNEGSLSMTDLYESIKATMELNFSTYICGHSTEEYKKENLLSHVRNIENLQIDSSTKQNTIGFETYCSKYEGPEGKSEIVFTIDKVNMQNL
jgi:glyoxylase-like metal-dependent hydrolase (beta-lactamase superfamily II)